MTHAAGSVNLINSFLFPEKYDTFQTMDPPRYGRRCGNGLSWLAIGLWCVLITAVAVPASATDFSAWNHSHLVTLPGYTNTATLTNFPVLVVLNTDTPGFVYSNVASGSGGDLRFADETRTNELMYEIESWDTDGSSLVWVQVPLLDDNTAIWAYWGNTTATSPPAYTTDGSTWSEDFVRVYHFDKTGATILDSSPAQQNGNNSGLSVGTGVVGNCAEVLDDNDLMTMPAAGPSIFTASLWYYFDHEDVDGYNSLVGYWGGGSDHIILRDNEYGFACGYSPGSFFKSSGVLLETNTWHHLAIAVTPNSYDPWFTCKFYHNGNYLTESDQFFDNAGDSMNVVSTLGTGQYEAWGALDELRVESVARPDHWIRAAWLNMASNNTFCNHPWVDNLEGATAVAATSATLNGWVAAPGSVAVYWGPGDGGTDPSQWQYTNSFGVLPSCGFLLTNVSFPAGGSYYYRYCLSNDDVVAWAAPPATFCAGEIAVYADDSQSAETGPDEGVFTVCREASATSAPLIVNYAVAGTASNGADYLPLAGTVTIAAGQTSEVVTVIPIDDEVWKEGFETVELTLAPGSYLISSQDQATVYIADNDLPFNWAFEMPVIFSGYDGLGTLTDFVALVCLDSTIPGFTYSNFASPFGYDLRFVNDTGMRLLPYEIEVWNTNGRSLLWVQAPELAGNDTTIWAYWGDKDLTNTPTFLTNGATWSRDFQIVYHYNQESGDIVDSSPNRNHGLNTGLSFTTGLVGNCIEVDDHDGITIPAVTNEELSACMWYYFTETGDDDWSTPFGINGSSYMHLMIADDTRQVGFYNWGWYSSGTVLATNQWHFLYIVANGSSYKLYHNGQSTPIMQSGSFFNNAAHNMQSVASAVPGAWYETWGRVEETRIENVSRSGDWTRACWLNMMSNETFVSFGEIAPWGGSVFIIR